MLRKQGWEHTLDDALPYVAYEPSILGETDCFPRPSTFVSAITDPDILPPLLVRAHSLSPPPR